MILAPCPPLRLTFFNPSTGLPLSGGIVYSVQPGTTAQFGIAPAYPMPTYTDSTGLIQNQNPFILGIDGGAYVWVSGYTRFFVFDANGNLIASPDNISATPYIQPSTLQFIPQSLAITYIDANSFSVPGDQTGIFVPGTMISAGITGGTIYGVVTASSAAGTPTATTVTVSWFSTALNASVVSISAGIISPAGNGSAVPLPPPVTVTASFTPDYTYLFKKYLLNCVTPAMQITLMDPTTVPPDSWIEFRNVASSLTVAAIQFIGTVDGITNPYMLGASWKTWSDGTYWHADIREVHEYGITPNAILTNGAQTSYTTLSLAGVIPSSARGVWGAMSLANSGKVLTLSADGTDNMKLGTAPNQTCFFRGPLKTPQVLWYKTDETSAYSNSIIIFGYYK